MSKPTSPCLNCSERTTNCHSICKKYIAYKDKLNEYNSILRHNKCMCDEVTSYEIQRYKRRKR